MNLPARMERDERIAHLRTPPCAIDAEQAVLGALLLSEKAWTKVGDWLREEDFYRRDHQLIYRAIAELAEADKPRDAVTIGDWFEAQGLAEQVGGVGYVIELGCTQASAANIVAYAEIVREKARLRMAIDIGTTLANGAFEGGRAADDVLGMAHHAIAQLQVDQRAGGLAPVRPMLKDFFADLQDRYERKVIPGLPTPWVNLNKPTHGLQNGELIVVAGRSNMGKSVWGFQLAGFTAIRGKNVATFSMEMTHRQCMRRLTACIGEVPHDWLMGPDDSDERHWGGVNRAIELLATAPLVIDESARLTAAQIAARAKRAHLQRPIDLLVIDHLHEVRLPGKEGEVIERGDAVREFKALAKALNCPVVLLAQLSRAAAKENGRRPRMDDLRGSGGIEEVADVILLLHREDYYRPDTHMQGVVEVILAKGRDIKTGHTAFLRNRFDCMRMDDWDGPLPALLESQAPQRPKSKWTGGARDYARAKDGDA